MPRSRARRAHRPVALALGLAVLPCRASVGDPASAPALAIDHEPPGCVAAERYARLSVCFRPEGSLARGRIYFRAEGTGDWFYVEMTGEPPCLQGVLPRPRKDLEAIEYYVSGMDRDLAETRSAVYTSQVTRNGACRVGPLALTVEPTSVIIGSPSGVAPAGFVTGDGLSPGLILGVAGAGAALTALLLAGREEREETPPPNPPAQTRAASHTPLLSDLAVPGGRGWITIDGERAFFTGPGAAAQPIRLAPGAHSVEAVLTDAQGEPGWWRFDLTALGLAPGSLRIVVGEEARVGPAEVAVQMRGEPGGRVIFTFRVEGR